ncbi:superoxide dismutase family protein [Candidatus Poribacteria bacterium]|nr:superoxide dismutase family protein [Candidatus Poribacteria bacterium]MYA99643.1 superoxide dismutase family protein [Candidatus Poribacteria bacterium]
MRIKYNTYTALITLIITAGLVSSCERIPTQVIITEPVEKVAVAVISEKDRSGLTGKATFAEMNGAVHVRIEIQNAVPGLHAAHLHIGTCADVGPHWHPMGIPAGTVGVPIAEATPDMPPIGVGEIGNIRVNADGTGVLEFTTPFWSLGGALGTDILGKLVLIHETGDTFQTNPHTHHTGVHTHNMTQMEIEMVAATHTCTLTVLGQQIDLEMEHHLPGQTISPHSHEPLELLFRCFFTPEQLLDLAFLSVIQMTESPAYQAFLETDPTRLAAYHEFFLSKGAPIDPDFFTNQYRQTFLTETPEEFEQEMRMRLTHLYISSGIDFENPAALLGYNQLLITFLDARTTAWMLGYFQGDDVAFAEWIVSVVKEGQVRTGGGARITCGVIELIE